MVEDLLGLSLRLGATFEQLGVDYFLGGSFASSLQGEPRAAGWAKMLGLEALLEKAEAASSS